jgi:formylglycine-generating enzyme required for sulfatase activity
MGITLMLDQGGLAHPGRIPARTARRRLRTDVAATSFAANGYDVFAMIGNAWEWTVDWYAQKPRCRCAEGLLRSAKFARRPGSRKP